LYPAHIPLYLPPEVGNNVVLAERLGIGVEGWFGDYRGVPIGVWGLAPPRLVARDSLLLEVNHALGAAASSTRLIPGGPEVVGKVGIITGGAGNMIAAAQAAGLDTFITGEGAHHTYFDAMEWGVNVLFAGHYATETLGVQALASHLAERFGRDWEFHAHPTGLCPRRHCSSSGSGSISAPCRPCAGPISHCSPASCTRCWVRMAQGRRR